MSHAKETFSRNAADSAVHSLIEEVELTPKPGLVDIINNGAHQDLSIELMRKSARSLKETFEQIALISYGNSPSLSLREEIAAIGRNGENRMFETTGGVNTHKGAIWAIGLLVAAAAMGKGCYAIKEIVSLAGETARYPDRHCPITATNGMLVSAKYGVNGARAEAEQGFPHIVHVSMPMLKQARAFGFAENEAQLYSLLALIASLDDTCILHRGGPEALIFAKRQAASVLTSGSLEMLKALDEEFTRLNISPGGSADMLAATLFLDKIQRHIIGDVVQKEVGSIH
ncbi:triphosphoribosyl-dephospho-CoA synthase [Peribacillus frigoritolerans]|uniref:triphosphoribosyl-dephospho-CoA synthase n=1 Tax=Peribacillus frigoritolerans TaxID=450367 RepID=UPI002079D651|nr:triphosphoribosyl-dephospho-CoA synthase [Peribacillus frigoritolerans]USK82733.1 triphosphoribosyl-dephospho-CoA synthase [Peribacillus frigoritolerans]WJE49997.1 triphosphoribosyl-dephospho-CoA synthase [Peribacillus frigoritolerans]